ncbi:tripartite tricarboxylate transporter substrate binding protein [Variovorax sp. J31P207]|uniref:Bug family tripartite tricarboxylate transporter substrate binding protein n=1 Tax=Variovorax sp. J31P207 TaxID=3053510 RepID=UPI00257710D5|nr:tripartite tricarboxylate transporter substrate binding protein [Variovorax sp. J31P207]MDM0069967.1 tripartite tricarboxylate transporter substrate binding protein [Variovorax sp. J31P207]
MKFQAPNVGTPDPSIVARRQLAVLAVAVCVLSASGLPARAEGEADFPSRPIKILVPYSAGTGSDAIARTVAQVISERTGKAIIVENREGGGSLIGTMALVKAPADGYTLLMAANPTAILPSQSTQPPYDPIRDLVPVAKVGVIPLVLAVSPALGINSVKDFIAYARANPGKLSYGSSGPGTISQQEMEIFKQAVGIEVIEIPYKSTSQAMTDLIGGILPVFPVVIPLVSQHLQNGRATALAVLDSRRSELLPNVPAITEEVKVPGYSPTPVWYGFVAPARTPAHVVSTLEKLINMAMESPDVRTRMTALGAQRINVSNEQFGRDLRSEYEKAGALAKKMGTYK